MNVADCARNTVLSCVRLIVHFGNGVNDIPIVQKMPRQIGAALIFHNRCSAPIFQNGGYAAFLTVAPVTGRPVDMDDLAPSPFEIATAELRRLGLDLTRLPGEYRVNFQNGTDATAQIAETLEPGACRRPDHGGRAGRGQLH